LDDIQAYYDGEAGPVHGGERGPGSDFSFTVPEGTEIVAASGTVSERWGYVASIKFTTSDGKVFGPYGHTSGKAWTSEGGNGYALAFLKGISGDALNQLSLCWQPPVLVCSAPVGTSTGGEAFSDKAFYKPGSKITGIKIRVGGAALDDIQAYYDGEAGPVHGGERGPGSDFSFTVPEGTEIVAASGTVSERWGYVASIKFTTSDGKVFGPYGHTSGKAWTSEGGNGYALAFLKGISGDALNQLSLCWQPSGGEEILNCEAILDAADFIYHITVWQKCSSSLAAYPGIFNFSDNTCSPSSCVELVMLSPLCNNLPPFTHCREWQKTAQQLVNIATEYCSAGSNKKAVSKPLGRGECEAIAGAQRIASYATVVQGCENPSPDIPLQLQQCSKLSCMANVFKQCSFCVEYSCDVYKRFTNMEKDLSKIQESHCDIPDPRGDVCIGVCCFSSSSLITTQNGQTDLKNLKLNDHVLTYTPGVGTHYTEFLGWIDRGSSATMLEISTSNSSTITLSAEHVIFRMSKNGALESVFASDIGETDILIKPNEKGDMHTEEVVKVRKVTIDSFGAPLTADGTILVDGFLASCYAYFPHEIGEFFMAPLKRYPTVLLDNEQSQHENGLRKSVEVLMSLGKSLGLDGHDGQRQPMEEVKRMGELYGLGGEDEDSLQQSVRVLKTMLSL